MNGKVCMITGANSGIGKETARELSRMGATIIMLCRNEKKGKVSLEDIKSDTKNDKIELFIADLEKPETIKQMVKKFKEKYDRLDVLVNNAGLILLKHQLNENGIERTLAINHIGHFILTSLLLDLLKASAPSRIINVSSAGHTMAKLNFDDLMLKKKFGPLRAYGNSKLANLLFTYELSRKLEDTNVTVNAVHPGWVRSNFGQPDTNKFVNFFYMLMSPFMINPQKGARTSIYLASSPEVKQTTGKYFTKCKAIKSSKLSYNPEVQRKLWEITEKLTGIK